MMDLSKKRIETSKSAKKIIQPMIKFCTTSYFETIILIFFILGFFTSTSQASHPIIIDGLFNDWENISIAASDPEGDFIIEDFAGLKITNDNNFLFLNLSFHNGDQLLQEENNVRLYIDTDNNILTGLNINGIGAELELEFGTFSGYYHTASGRESIEQNDITLRRAPSVSAEQFEIGISLNCFIMTLNGTQEADTVSIIFLESDSKGDLLPNNLGGIRYIVDTNKVAPPLPIPLAKFNVSDVRIVTYNVQNHKSHSIDNEEKREHFKRVLKALEPDIIALQHVHTNNTIDQLIGECFPDIVWYKMGISQEDKFIFSKFPILERKYNFINSYSMDAVLLDTKKELGSTLLLFNTHLEAYSWNDDLRQNAVDNFIQLMRDWRKGCRDLPFNKNIPFCVVGDFNMYGSSKVLRTIRDGDIWNETNYGADFPPDWDGTSMTDIFSRHTHTNMGYTWRNDNLIYPPSKIDYIFYSDSNIEIGNHFILNTLAMPNADLLRYNLQQVDTDVISEHLPHVADIVRIHHIEQNDSLVSKQPCKTKLNYAYPNPFNQFATIDYELPRSSNVKIVVYNSLGREITTLVNANHSMGRYKVELDGSKLSSGVYFYRLQSENFSDSKKIILLR
ncbi:MAG: T9SS type A sorting domain-containing protein [Ignavibacteriae bacterium]|nr:T9SS type A sorting domain-containing protein [Ignavibacteriota bacterium]